MQKFSTPDEIFGQVSISELKKDNYKRLTEGFLPTATFAFLDEIWKSSPAILNTLLTILNERLFKNGKIIENCPLKVIISASNEVPPKNQGLEALYDRFLLRVPVFPIKDKNNFEILLESNNVKTKTNISIPIGVFSSFLLIYFFENRQENRRVFYAISLICGIISFFLPIGFLI